MGFIAHSFGETIMIGTTRIIGFMKISKTQTNAATM